MRMRKKKNLESRTEACGAYLMYMESEDLNFETAKNNTSYLDFSEMFGNDNPVYLEIGCGKGQFVCELAKDESLPNVRFLKCGAEYLECFIPDHSISGIFLNFSCPFPKKAYTSHRLTNERFLMIYKKLMKAGAELHQKTDNMHFFEYSIEELTKCGFALKNVSLDLHGSDFEGNIVTEYENKYLPEG